MVLGYSEKSWFVPKRTCENTTRVCIYSKSVSNRPTRQLTGLASPNRSVASRLPIGRFHTMSGPSINAAADGHFSSCSQPEEAAFHARW